MNEKFVTRFCGIFFGIAMVFTTYTILTEKVAPNGGHNFAFGQTGPTGPTGPTGATGPVAASGAYNGHNLFTGTPVVSNCGVNPSSANSTDTAGVVTVGKDVKNNLGAVIPILQCTITFGTAFTHTPSVNLTLTGGNGVVISSQLVTTTAFIVYFTSNAQSLKFSWTAF